MKLSYGTQANSYLMTYVIELSPFKQNFILYIFVNYFHIRLISQMKLIWLKQYIHVFIKGHHVHFKVCATLHNCPLLQLLSWKILISLQRPTLNTLFPTLLPSIHIETSPTHKTSPIFSKVNPQRFSISKPLRLIPAPIQRLPKYSLQVLTQSNLTSVRTGFRTLSTDTTLSRICPRLSPICSAI